MPNPAIQIYHRKLKFSPEYLGCDRAWVWVGPGLADLDNDRDAAVLREAEDWGVHETPEFPFGLCIGNRPRNGNSIEMSPMLIEHGSYVLDTFWWPAGVYRLNYHSPAGVATAQGTDPAEDPNGYSWAAWGPDRRPDALKEVRDFVHRERNGQGYCFRITVMPDSIFPFGDPSL